MGYGVFPMAIENDVIMAVSRREDTTVNVRHVLADKFADDSFEGQTAGMRSDHSWVNYVIAGYMSVTQDVKIGMDIVIDGNVPLGSGLSSSSAITVCSAVATLRARDPSMAALTKPQLSELTAQFERLVGTACGGMDQTISIMAQRGSAAYIQFNPIRSTLACLPSDVTLVLCDSMTASNKIESLGKHYNMRVVECRMGIELIKRKKQIENSDIKILMDLQNHLELNFKDLARMISQSLKSQPYTAAELQAEFGVDSLMEIVGDVGHA